MIEDVTSQQGVGVLATYTRLKDDMLSKLLREVSDDKLLYAQGVVTGVENTTYRLCCEHDQVFYLTLFEQQTFDQVSAVLKLLEDCASHGLRVQFPLGGGQAVGCLMCSDGTQRPWIICPALAGASVFDPGLTHCERVGEFLGRLHGLTGRDSSVYALPDAPWQGVFRDFVRFQQSAGCASRVADFFAQHAQCLGVCAAHMAQLPQVAGHGDLFVDNVLFEGDQLSGVLDFFNAYRGPRLYDLAVAVLAWGLDAQGVLHRDRVQAMLRGYQKNVFLTDIERHTLPEWLSLGALRFWTSRTLFAAEYGQTPIKKDHCKPPEWFEPTLNLLHAQPDIIRKLLSGI